MKKNIAEIIADIMGWKKVYSHDSGREIYSDIHYNTNVACEDNHEWNWYGWETPYKDLRKAPKSLINIIDIFSGGKIPKHNWRPQENLNHCKVFEDWLHRKYPLFWKQYGNTISFSTDAKRKCQNFVQIMSKYR